MSFQKTPQEIEEEKKKREALYPEKVNSFDKALDETIPRIPSMAKNIVGNIVKGMVKKDSYLDNKLFPKYEMSEDMKNKARDIFPSLNFIEGNVPSAADGKAPLTPEELSQPSRKPSSLSSLPKVSSAPSSKQAAIKDIQKEEAESIKPEQPKEMSEMDKALERVRQNRMAAAIQRSSSGLGAAIASVGALKKIAPDEESLKNIEEGIEAPVQELKFKQDQEKVQRDLANASKMADPNSDISVMTRSMLGQVGLSHLAKGNISAQDLKNAGIDVDTLLAKKIQMEQTAAMRMQSDALRKDARVSDMAARLAPKIQNEQYGTMASLQSQAELIRQAVQNPNPQNDAAIIYGFIKTLDPNSAVKEGEIDFTKSARSYSTQLKQAITAAVHGDQLSEDERKNILDFAMRAANEAKRHWQTSAAPYLKQAERLGIPKEMVTGVDLDEKQDSVNKAPSNLIPIMKIETKEIKYLDAATAERVLRKDPDKYKRVD